MKVVQECLNKPITVVHRSDGSGTTFIWVDYLSKVSKEWETTVGKGTSVKWPIGLGGKGNGPAAEGLTVPPPDLTALARKNGGKYPSDHVRSAIEGDLRLPTHGAKEMPAWGDLFWRMSQGHSSEVQLRSMR